MSPEAPEAAVTSRQWLCAGSDTKSPWCHLVLPATQGQQSLAVVARGVLLQEGELCQRTSPGQAWFKVLGTAPHPGHPAGIPAAVEEASTSSLQPDQPTLGLLDAGSPCPGDAQPLCHSWLRSPQGSCARKGCPCPLTSIMWCSDLSNRSMNSPRMLNRSISLREIMIRVRVLSSVPAPCKGELQ